MRESKSRLRGDGAGSAGTRGRGGAWARAIPLPGAILLVCFLLAGQGVFAGGDSGDPVVRFRWAFMYRDIDDGVVKPIDYGADPVPLASGDRFSIRLMPLGAPAPYIYLYLHDAQDSLRLFFPEDLSSWDTYRRAGKSYDLPRGGDWFYLDRRGGVETFYLVASAHRLSRLEAATRRHLRRRTEGRGGRRLAAARREVLEELRRLLMESSRLAETVEKPVLVAGDFRGIEGEVEVHGMTVEALGVYVRTIRLKH